MHRLTEVEDHAGKNDESKPDIEVGDKVDDGNDDVTDGGEDTEQDVAEDKNNHGLLLTPHVCVSAEPNMKTCNVWATEPPSPGPPQQVVDGGSASVDAPQHVSGASLQVPAQGQTMQVGKQTHLKCGGRGTERDVQLCACTTITIITSSS